MPRLRTLAYNLGCLSIALFRLALAIWIVGNMVAPFAR